MSWQGPGVGLVIVAPLIHKPRAWPTFVGRPGRYYTPVPRFKDQAICIRDLDWSESSQLVVLLTREHGKIRGLAKGSRRASPSAVARFCGGINLLNTGQVIATTRATTQLAAITEWNLQNDAFHLRTDLQAQWLAMYAADVVNAMLADEDPHAQTFDALTQLLADLADPDAHQAALLRFQWALLVDCGLRPALDEDVSTGQPLGKTSTYTFDPQLGGFTTRQGINDTAWRVRVATIHALRDIASGQPTDQTDPQTRQRANRLLCAYLRAILDKELPTMPLVLSPMA